MNYKRFLGAASAVLMFIIVTLALEPGAWAQVKYKTLYRFNTCIVGQRAACIPSGLIFDGMGNLYGTTYWGGADGYGTVFEMTPNTDGSWTESVLHSFSCSPDCSNGIHPAGGLIFDTAGNLYGATAMGGPGSGLGYGTVFKLTPNTDGSWTESVLYSFCPLYPNCSDGFYPNGVILDHAGNLYGTTYGGGADGYGTVFEMTPNTDGSWTESVLHSFGIHPAGGLISDGAGNLYGTLAMGGNCDFHSSCGAAFRLSPNADGSWTESVLHRFCSLTNCSDGEEPNTPLVFDQAGNLYGTTAVGGVRRRCLERHDGRPGCGVVFKLSPNSDGSWTESVLHTFTGRKDGGVPSSGLTFDQAGNLYGTTTYGGYSGCQTQYEPSGCGVVFKLAPNSNGGWNETVLHAFRFHPRSVSSVGLIFDAAGNLYGTTLDQNAYGGCSPPNCGSVFEITP